MGREKGVTFVLFCAVLKMHRLNIELLFFLVRIIQKTNNIILKLTWKVDEQAVISVQKWTFFILPWLSVVHLYSSIDLDFKLLNAN